MFKFVAGRRPSRMMTEFDEGLDVETDDQMDFELIL